MATSNNCLNILKANRNETLKGENIFFHTSFTVIFSPYFREIKMVFQRIIHFWVLNKRIENTIKIHIVDIYISD